MLRQEEREKMKTKVKVNKIQKYSAGRGEKPHRRSHFRNKQRRKVNGENNRKRYYSRKDT